MLKRQVKKGKEMIKKSGAFVLKRCKKCGNERICTRSVPDPCSCGCRLWKEIRELTEGEVKASLAGEKWPNERRNES